MYFEQLYPVGSTSTTHVVENTNNYNKDKKFVAVDNFSVITSYEQFQSFKRKDKFPTIDEQFFEEYDFYDSVFKNISEVPLKITFN